MHCPMYGHVPYLCKGCCVFSDAQVGPCAHLLSLTFSVPRFPHSLGLRKGGLDALKKA